jgi:hypothetical protein
MEMTDILDGLVDDVRALERVSGKCKRVGLPVFVKVGYCREVNVVILDRFDMNGVFLKDTLRPSLDT